jgi:Protein of unknown function (DUF4232)
MASVNWASPGGIALIVAAVALGAACAQPAAARPVSTAISASAAAVARAESPAALAVPARVIPRCTAGQLRVRADGYQVGLGHVDDYVGLWNAGSTCKLAGWARVAAIKASGARSFPARLLNGWGWGGHPTLTAPPTVVIARGRKGYVVIAGFNFRADGSPCAAPFKKLQITPPGARLVTIALPYLPDCGPLSVSPVVPPSEVP